jgi:hypothetical protein
MQWQEAKKPKRVVSGASSEMVRQSHKADRGQALLEVGLALPLLCLLSVGIVEVGRAARMSMVLTNAATAGAQYGALSSVNAGSNPPTGIQSAALCDANGGNWGACSSGILTSSNITIHHGCRCDDGTGLSCELPMPADGTCSTISCGTEPTVECIQVLTTATYPALFPWPGLPGSYQSNGNSVMRVQQ